jgi:hypothetical protein
LQAVQPLLTQPALLGYRPLLLIACAATVCRGCCRCWMQHVRRCKHTAHNTHTSHTVTTAGSLWCEGKPAGSSNHPTSAAGGRHTPATPHTIAAVISCTTQTDTHIWRDMMESCQEADQPGVPTRSKPQESATAARNNLSAWLSSMGHTCQQQVHTLHCLLAHRQEPSCPTTPPPCRLCTQQAHSCCCCCCCCEWKTSASPAWVLPENMALGRGYARACPSQESCKQEGASPECVNPALDLTCLSKHTPLNSSSSGPPFQWPRPCSPNNPSCCCCCRCHRHSSSAARPVPAASKHQEAPASHRPTPVASPAQQPPQN